MAQIDSLLLFLLRSEDRGKRKVTGDVMRHLVSSFEEVQRFFEGGGVKSFSEMSRIIFIEGQRR